MTCQPLPSNASIWRNQIRESDGLCTTVMTSTLRVRVVGSRLGGWERLPRDGAVVIGSRLGG